MKVNIQLHITGLVTCACILLSGCGKQHPDNGPSEPETPVQENPAIIVQQTSYTVDASGGTLSIPYTVNNPAETGTVSAEPDADWITIETVTSTDIVMGIRANDIAQVRTASVNVIYTYGDNSDTVSRNITVEQEAMVPDPRLVIELEGSPTVPVEGGVVSIPYTVIYPVEGGEISVLTEAAWIKADDISETQVTLAVSENQSAHERAAAVNIVYTYGDGDTVSCQVSIIQEALETEYDYYVPDAYFRGELYDYSIAAFTYFRVKLSDMEMSAEGDITEGACCYDMTVYTSSVAYDSNDNPFPPAGSYTYGTSTSAGEFSGWFYPAEGGTGCGIQEGTMAISLDGSTMSITINLTDEQGKTHCVQYSGQPVIDIAVQI